MRLNLREASRTPPIKGQHVKRMLISLPPELDREMMAVRDLYFEATGIKMSRSFMLREGCKRLLVNFRQQLSTAQTKGMKPRKDSEGFLPARRKVKN